MKQKEGEGRDGWMGNNGSHGFTLKDIKFDSIYTLLPISVSNKEQEVLYCFNRLDQLAMECYLFYENYLSDQNLQPDLVDCHLVPNTTVSSSKAAVKVGRAF